jgi:hypothetical protein
MNHASTDPDNDGVIDVEYGDESCPMGGARMVRFNALHRFELDWFNAANMVTNPSGTMTLTSASIVGSAASSVALVRLTRPTLTDNYWVSMRTASGTYDGALPSGWFNVVYLHRWTPYVSAPTLLVALLTAGQYINIPGIDSVVRACGCVCGKSPFLCVWLCVCVCVCVAVCVCVCVLRSS